TPTTSTLQIGTGVSISSNRQNFNQGSLTLTGVQTDIGISGDGFFRVEDPNNTSVAYYTRDGNFTLNPTGTPPTQAYLVNSAGYRLLGVGGTAIQIQLTNGTASLRSFSISNDGVITQYYSDGSSVINPTNVGLTKFADPTKLVRASGNLYTHGGPANNITHDQVQAGTQSLGMTKQGTLELSNVDLAQEFSELIVSQRAFQAGSRIITVSDSVLEEIVNLKR
ncbi:MAG: flagellar hook-basal body complex protein, partial [Chthoniobacterales bacterium]|nr:flagellar hook-basal body complex protein [Chthoniobacterales bacterium]